MNKAAIARAILLLGILWISKSLASGQTCQDQAKYRASMAKAEALIAESKFEEAQKQYDVALIYCRKEMATINAAKEALFVKINQLRKLADSTALAALGSNLAYKSRAALEAGNRGVAFQIARMGLFFSQADHPDLFAALFAAQHYNSMSGVEVKVPRYSRLMGHSSSVFSGDISLDGRQVVTSSLDGSVKIWDFATGNLLKSFSNLATGPSLAVFSPDGKQIAVGSFGKTVSLLSADKRKVVWTGAPDWAGVVAMTFADQGKLLMLGKLDGTFAIFKSENGELVYSEQNPNPIRRMVPMPGGQQVVSMNDVGRIEFRNLQGQVLNSYETGLDPLKGGLAILPKSNLWLYGNNLGEVKSYNLQNGQEAGSFGAGIADIEQVAISPEGKFVAVTAKDYSIQIFAMPFGRLVARCNGHSRLVAALAFSPDGNHLLSSSHDQTSTLWHWRRELDERAPKLLGEIEPKLNLDAQGRMLELSIPDGQRQLKDRATGAIVHTFPKTPKPSHFFQCSPGGKYCVFLDGNEASVWETGTWKEKGKAELNSADIVNLAFSPDGEMLWVCGKDLSMKAYACADMRLLQDPKIHANEKERLILPVPGNKMLGLAEGDKLRIFNLAKQDWGHDIPLTIYLQGCNFRFSLDGKYVAIGTWNSSLQVWDLEKGRLLWRTDIFGEAVSAIQFSPDGRYLLIGMRSGQLHIMDFQRQISMLSLQMGDEVTDIDFGPDGRQLYVITVTGFKVMAWETSAILEEWQAASAESFLTFQQLQQYEIVNIIKINKMALQALEKEFGPWQLKAFADWLGNPLVFSEDEEATQLSFQNSDLLYDFVETKLSNTNVRQDHLNMLGRWESSLSDNSERISALGLKGKQERLIAYLKNN